MNFSVLFAAESGFPVNISRADIGIKGVDLIREILGFELPLDRMDEKVKGYIGSVEIELGEEIARESGLFEDTNFIKVKVPEFSLNEFTFDKVEVDQDSKTGEVTRAYIRISLDIESILSAWKEACYPTDWNPEDYKGER